MPVIRPSSDLRNNYNEISEICHKTKKPVYITKNGSGDLAVMSIESYELLADKEELYRELEKGVKSIREGKVFTAEEVHKALEKIYGVLTTDTTGSYTTAKFFADKFEIDFDELFQYTKPFDSDIDAGKLYSN